jgi:hypothetical protein
MCRKLLLIAFVLVVGLASNTLAQVPANQDVGNPPLAGNVVYDPVADTWTVQGNGADVWGSWDQFHYVYRPLAGDGSASLRIAAMEVTSGWAKAGVMVRETLDGDSKHAAIAMTGSNGIQTFWRSETGGSSEGATSGGQVPWFVKIVRSGDTISTFLSPIGDPVWQPTQVLTIPMNTNVYIGMFVSSVNADVLNTTVFDNVSLDAPPFLEPWALSPADGAVLSADGVTLSWMSGDTGDSQNVYLGTSSPPPLAVNQAETSYPTGALEGGATYYWQIGSLEADGTTEYLSEERSFTTLRPGTGSILYQAWEGIGGVALTDLRNNANFPLNPTWTAERTSLEAPLDWADNFGARMIGWLSPVTSGDYTFWIAADDYTDLLLSTTDHPADTVRIAGHTDWTSSREWTKHASQKSDPVSLVGGEMYYIEAIYKEGGGGDNCAVAWEGPDSPERSIIDGSFLMPWEGPWPLISRMRPLDGATGVSITPTLSWVAPEIAVDSYDVYLDGEVVASGADTSATVGPLLLGSSHAWQVATNSGAETIMSPVLTFTVADSRLIDDFEAYDVVPEDASSEMNVIGGDYVIPGTPEQVLDPVDPGTDNLVAYYPLDGDTLDASGNGHDATAVGDPAVVDGPAGYGQALRFTPGAGDDYVDCGTWDPSEGTGQITVALWLNWDGISGEWMGMIGKRDNWAANDMMWHIEAAQGDGAVSVSREAGSSVGGYGVPVIGEWEHCAFTFDGSTCVLYRDGDEVGRGGFSFGTDPEAALLFGADNGGGWNPWPGALDEVRLYNDALTNLEVRHLADAGPLVIPEVPDEYVPPIFAPMALNMQFEGDYTMGPGREATPVGDISFADDPIMGSVLSLPGGSNQYVDCGGVGISGNDPTTIACWAKADHTDIPDWTLIFGFTGTETGQGGNGSHFNIGSIGGPQGIGAHVWGWEETILTDAESLDWHHYAMTYNGSRIEYYADGMWKDTEPESAKSNNRDLSIRADRVYIGSRITQDSSFPGDVDDARVYNYALSPAEIAGLAGYVPENPITDTWSAWGFADVKGGAGTMEVITAGIPGLPYYIGEVSRAVEDLSLGGAAAASVWFRGDGANGAEHMYAVLSDGDDSEIVLYDGDAADLANEDWQEWNIDLSGIAATEIALGLAGLDGSGEGDVVSFDDLRTYPPRCLPDRTGLAADLNDDCKVDIADLEILIGQWGGEVVSQDWEYRAAYWDERYRTNWASEEDSVAVRDALVDAGYTVVNADELKEWMDARIADGALSVVVLCRDNAPDTVVESIDANCTLRKYLDAGGKLVYYADIPFWDIGHVDGSWDNPGAAGQMNILGIGNIDRWDTNNTVTITDVGAAWGLTQTWQSLRANDPTGLTVLATDDAGYAAAYVKHYLPGDVARGFVRLFDRTGGELPPVDDIVRAAEHKGTLTADLYEDGKIDWNDVFVLLDEWLAEKLWP